jgi:hypothetical protein
MDRDHHHRHIRIALVDQLGGFDAIQVGHAYIGQDHIRSQGFDQLNHFVTIGGLPDHFDVWLGIEQYHEALPDHDMVVSDEYFDLFYAQHLLPVRDSGEPGNGNRGVIDDGLNKEAIRFIRDSPLGQECTW